MNLLNKLTLKNLRLNKKRTIVTVVGIILSVALISALSSLVISFQSSMILYEKTNVGNFHISFSGLNEEDVEKIKQNRELENSFFSYSVGYAKIDEIKNENKPYAFITAYDYGALNNLGINLIEGRLPATNKEIVIPHHLKTNGRVDYKIGDVIKLNVGTRKSDGYELDQSNPFTTDGSKEYLDNTSEIEYKVVGIIDRPSYKIEPYSSPGYSFITCLDTKEKGAYNAYVRLNKKGLKNYLATIAHILGVNEELYLKFNNQDNITEEEYNKYQSELDKAKLRVTSINTELISLEGGNMKDGTMQALLNVAIVVVFIIIVTSVFCIKNSFSISITEKTKQYGMLASIGATKKQIKKNVLYEALILGLIGIPIGILGGLLAAYILIYVCNSFLSSALNLDMIFSISFLSIFLSIILGALTIYLSAISCARKASRISPIMAIRNNDDIKIDEKKIKSPKIIKKIFGIGGDVSYKNMKRNKKKYRTTVISIIVCVSVFIALYSFMNLAFKTVDLMYGSSRYNIGISAQINNKSIYDRSIKDLLLIEGNKKYSILRNLSYNLEKPIYSKEYKATDDYKYQVAENQINNINVEIYSVGREEYSRYVKSLGLNPDSIKNKGILINNEVTYIYHEDDNSTKKTELPILDYKVGDKLKGTYKTTDNNKVIDQDYEIELASITYERPMGLENIYGMPFIIVSDDVIDKIDDDYNYELYVDYNDADKAQDEAEKILNGIGVDRYRISNRDQEAKAQQSLFTLVAIFLYGFITVIALIGVTNIFNTITTSMELRSREFAMLKSIGMTRKEFNRMISLESVFYGTKSLLIGIPIGCGLSYLIYKLLVDGDLSFAYNLPYLAIIISIIAVYALVTMIMKVSINKIRKQNTIETIRNDNI